MALRNSSSKKLPAEYLPGANIYNEKLADAMGESPDSPFTAHNQPTAIRSFPYAQEENQFHSSAKMLY